VIETAKTKMDTPPQPPQKSHLGNTSVISARERTSEDFDAQIQGGRAKGMKFVTNTGNERRVVELVPKPSESCADPLVCLPLPESIPIQTFRTGQRLRKKGLAS
jgi:hypothetical protein